MHVEDRRERLFVHDVASARASARSPARRRTDAGHARSRARRRDDRAALGLRPASSASCMASTARASISGPTSVAVVERVADRAAARRPRSAARRASSAIVSCTISRRRVVQRWPAVPAAAKTMPAGRELEVGATARRSRRCCRRARAGVRPNRAATRGRDLAGPCRSEPVALISGTRGLSISGSPTVASAHDHER